MPGRASEFSGVLASSAKDKQQPHLEDVTLESSQDVVLAAKELLLEYGQFVRAQAGIASFCYGALEQEAAELPQIYLGQSGGVLVGGIDSGWVGFVAWRALPTPVIANPETAWELKRLWIRPDARGSGLGRIMVQAVIDRARTAGKTLLYLDTAPDSMPTAHRLYLEMGFVECPAYSGPPLQGIAYLKKSL
jgi:GNAT superfamily N-acetyltransferase